MKSVTIKQTIKKYSVLVCLVTSVLLIVIATLAYPGGSVLDKNSVGFDWSKFPKQSVCNKSDKWFRKPWLDLGTYWHGIPLGWLWNFFINMSKKIASRQWATILKLIGATNIILIFLIATPLHDLGVLSIILTLIGLFTITVFILKSKLHLLKFCCIICLLTYYSFFSLFGLGYLGLSVIMQKVYIISSILLVLGLEYFTNYEDFIPIKSGGQKYKQRTADAVHQIVK